MNDEDDQEEFDKIFKKGMKKIRRETHMKGYYTAIHNNRSTKLFITDISKFVCYIADWVEMTPTQKYPNFSKTKKKKISQIVIETAAVSKIRV
jgi:hypothetical protein